LKNYTHLISWISFEIKYDLKNPGMLLSGFLQMVILGYIAFIAHPTMGGKSWIVLLLFCSVIGTQLAVSKAFLNQDRGRWLYIYQLASAGTIIWGKLIYSWIISILMCVWALAVFVFLNDWPLEHTRVFTGLMLLVSIGLGTIFTFTSALSSKSAWGMVVFPVLSLPAAIPLILIGSRGTIKCLNPVLVPSVYNDIGFLIGVDLLIVALVISLFSSLWRD
jgi:heme exporter protein B